MSIPKLNGIAAIMYGWHYLHVLVGFVRFFFRRWWTLRGKTEAIFSRYSCQPPAEGAPTLAQGLLCTNRLYVQGHFKSHIHMNSAA